MVAGATRTCCWSCRMCHRLGDFRCRAEFGTCTKLVSQVMAIGGDCGVPQSQLVRFPLPSISVWPSAATHGQLARPALLTEDVAPQF